jgi:hypothetical protein
MQSLQLLSIKQDHLPFAEVDTMYSSKKSSALSASNQEIHRLASSLADETAKNKYCACLPNDEFEF